MTVKSDYEIIEKVLSGDTEAFSVLVSKYSSGAFSLTYRICGDREAAEELTQDTFMKAYTNLIRFKGGSSFSTWLYRIAYNTAISHTRKKVREQTFDFWDNVAKADEIMLYDDEPDEQETKRRSEILAKALDLLNSDEKTLVTLFYKEDMPLKEIAAIMSLSETNAKTKLFRTRKKLAAIYKKMEGGQ